MNAPKRNYGRGGMPAHLVEPIAEDYRRLGSVRKVAKLHGRTQQSVWDILHRRGLTRPKVALPFIIHRGEKFSPGKNGYYRSTKHRESGRNLHRVIWEEAHGPVPPGHELRFLDNDPANCALENLRCLTKLECRRQRSHRNRWTIYKQALNDLHTAALAALDATDAAAMKVAIDALLELRAPLAGQQSREKVRAASRRQWAALTPAEHAARVKKAAASRKARRLEKGFPLYSDTKGARYQRRKRGLAERRK